MKTISQSIAIVLLFAAGLLAACQPAAGPTPAPTPLPATETPTPVEAAVASPLPTPTPTQLPAAANCPPAEQALAQAQSALTDFQASMAAQSLAELEAGIACWLNLGGDIAPLEAALSEPLAEFEGAASLLPADLTGSGNSDDLLVIIPTMGLPLLAFVNQPDGYRVIDLPPQPITIANGEPLPTRLQAQQPEQPPVELRDLTGDGQPEIIASYMLPGGSGFTLLPAVYHWQDSGFRLIFSAELINRAGPSTLTIAPDQTAANRQELVLSYPHLYNHGFDHKLLNHPLAQQIWRWDEAAGRFALATEMVDLSRSSLGQGAPIATEDRLRWLTNEGEAAFRAGDYAQALEMYKQVIDEAAAEGWQPTAEQPDWGAFATFRRGETLLLLSQQAGAGPQNAATEGVTALEAIATDYAADPLGELAQQLLAGFGDGTAIDAMARAVALMQAVDLYSHFYNSQPGALLFPMDAAGILFPGAGLAAYLNVHPEEAVAPSTLQAGLAAAGFAVEGVTLENGQVIIDLRLPQAPNADGRVENWTLIQEDGGWRVLLPDEGFAPPSGQPWPVVGSF